MPHDRTSASFTLAPGDDGPPPRCLCTCPTHAVHAAVRSIRRGHREELSRGGWVGGEWGKNCGVSGLRRNLINRSSNGASEQEFTAVEGTMRNVSYSGGRRGVICGRTRKVIDGCDQANSIAGGFGTSV